MEINKLQIREITELAKEAGPAALKGLSKQEQKILEIMKEALQNKEGNPITIKGLEEHQFTQIKKYLEKVVEEKRKGRISQIPFNKLEINQLQMRDMALLAQNAGKEALK